MKKPKPIASNASPAPDRKLRIKRSVSLYPEQEHKLIAAAVDAGGVSEVVRELIDRGLDDSGAKRYLDARDRGIQFAEDIESLLTAAGVQCIRDAKVQGGDNHRTDLLCTWKGRKICVELKSSSRPDRLELALGSAMVLRGESGLPAVVCVPYLLDTTVVRMYETTGVGISDPGSVVAVVKGLAERKAGGGGGIDEEPGWPRTRAG